MLNAMQIAGFDGVECNSLIFARFILLIIMYVYMCLFVINCLCVYFIWDW